MALNPYLAFGVRSCARVFALEICCHETTYEMNERVQAFWDCVKGSMYERRDGARGELVCSSCAGHVGHVYRNEGFQNPAPNERHCVNSSALVFRQEAADAGAQQHLLPLTFNVCR